MLGALIGPGSARVSRAGGGVSPPDQDGRAGRPARHAGRVCSPDRRSARGRLERELREVGGAGGIEVAGVDEGGAGNVSERVDAFAADEAAADDGEIELLGFCVGHSVSRMRKAKRTRWEKQVTFWAER